MLEVSNIEVIYSNVILVLRGVSLQVLNGNITVLLGGNGAGKTTTLKAISGLLRTELGKVTHGEVRFDGERIDRQAPEDIVRRGIVQAMQGRRLFEHLSVDENLKVGGRIVRDRGRNALEMVYKYFPRLKSLRNNTSGYLSGGEQQMLVIGRALMMSPKLMLLDEPSMGLAPILVREIFDIVKNINKKEKTAILLVEQNAMAALSIGDYGYVMEDGRIVLDGPAAHLQANEDIREFYLGLSQLGSRESYREVKHYKRRKRWLG